MKRIVVVSTSIASVGYVGTERILEVQFIKGAVYRYFGVPPEEYVLLLAADSKGRYVNTGIKPRFSCVRVQS